ncbi:methylenetetrahydrofolate reductase [Desulfonema magnum]|uniref:Methylenetetrahydrofolate reductase n=1 Tax=Desulfonema magnum TaxID=45655 RepID=A0A975BLJ6_9BACT|nr:methylenetetrahydrofolate reductase [Desulfonema magnum]QTA87340.1 Methylenetetrahydrofolate reductase [Desulfonema magnum]
MLLKSKFDTGKFAILTEMEPPKGTDVSEMVSNATRVKGMVDAFVVPEMSNAVMRMSALGGAMILQQKGMETVMQVCCRDRNRLALQADLLGASACGIRNIMAVTGEAPGFGDHHQAKAVYDIDLPELLQAIQSLQEGRDMAGVRLTGSPEFLVGSAINTGAKEEDMELELEKMNKNIEAGVRFFITPPLFDIAAIEPFLKRADKGKAMIIPTVLLLKSVGMARYIDRNMDHIYVPKPLITRIQKAGDKVRECLRVATEMISALKKEGFGGVFISTIGWENKLPELLEKI